MKNSVTLGVKVDAAFKERLHHYANKFNCTPHWLHKQALLSFLDQIESGKIPIEILHVDVNLRDLGADLNVENTNSFISPFFEFGQDVQPQSVLRAAITSAYRRPETECVPLLLEQAISEQADKVKELALQLVKSLKAKSPSGGVESLIQEFALSSQEGVALMCLAEALLRIPDKATRDALIRDKISHGNWKSHIGNSPSMFVNAATWGLLLTGKLTTISSENNLSNALTRLIAKGGEPLIRQGVNMAMRMMGEQFVTGQTISSALANSRKFEAQGFTYSYDMLGEAATTAEDAQRYYTDYEQAIHAIGKAAAGKGIYAGPGISIKLSALHPRYSRAQRERVIEELLPRVIELTKLAKFYDIGLNIDAEEADRLEISLDILDALCFHPDLQGWNGIGFVIQAYQKRAPYVIDYVIDLGRRSQHRLMIRLVKGAYWDSEIKRAQIDGLEGYPVYTRKIYTDVSYLACAKKLLSAPEAVFPQFATHNAQTLSSIYHLAGKNYYPGQYEFQCLHGMGEPLYEEVVGEQKLNRPCRIYAPVGTHETLLAYLVRRLLENGANTSFINQVADTKISLEDLVKSPDELVSMINPVGKPHDKIPLPRDIYKSPSSQRNNSMGIDLSNEHRLGSLSAALLRSTSHDWIAYPSFLSQEMLSSERMLAILNPANLRDIVGHAIEATSDEVHIAINNACAMNTIWQATPIQERAECLRKAAFLLESRMQTLLGLITREAGKSIPNGIAEVREAVDFLRYYAEQIEQHFTEDLHRPLGIIACISPWNFPLAIFMGQVAAALVAGNTVIAKPAEQTPLIAAQAIQILHEAGVPEHAVQLLPGQGETVGDALISSPEIKGVMFTGSTEVAKLIARKLAERLDEQGQTIPFIAETGGQNALIVDSSALPEQVVFDVINSAFDSAGQRCSALRVLCLQEEVADRIVLMLKGAMQELSINNPDLLSTDIGPVIDAQARQLIEAHIQSMKEAGSKVYQVEMNPETKFGNFVSPTLIELDHIKQLEREVFGPVLHVLRYKRAELDRLIDSINETGYGLTFGVHSRIDETITHICSRINAGNIYINRNIVGAVVGVQPFGGCGLSGTGPKAGGPLYLFRLLNSSAKQLPKPFKLAKPETLESELLGPTGESNIYRIMPKGTLLISAQTPKGLAVQIEQAKQSGNQIIVLRTAKNKGWVEQSLNNDENVVMADEDELNHLRFDAVLFEGDSDELKQLNKQLSQRNGPIVVAQGLGSDALQEGKRYAEIDLIKEQSISINTAAAGGNASLMTIA